MFLTIPNLITASRFPLTLYFWSVIEASGGGDGIWIGCLVVLLYLLDAIDGRLARRIGQTSKIGAFLDITSDKFTNLFVWFLLVKYRGVDIIWPAIFLWFDFYAYLLRIHILQGVGHEVKIISGRWSKWAYRIHYVAWAMVFGASSGVVYQIGLWVLYFSVLLGVYNRLEETWQQRLNLARIWSK